MLPDESDEDFDFFAQFLEDEAVEEEHVETTEAVSLFADYLAYAREAFEELDLEGVEWHEHLQGFTLEPPDDLLIRYQYLPIELRRQTAELKLSTDRNFIQKCLVDSRQDEEGWPEWELFWNQHPLAEWLNDKVLAHLQRHEAPVIRMKGLETPLCMFQGVVSNLRSQPVLNRWFGVQGQAIVETEELHRLLLPGLMNPGEDFDAQALSDDLPRVISLARTYVEAERLRSDQELLKKLKPEERRVQAWIKKKQAQFAGLSDGSSLRADQRRRLEREKSEVERRVKAREKWFKEGISTSPNVYLRVVRVLM